MTEGTAEYQSLPLIYPQLNNRSGNQIVETLKINVSPTAPEAVIARECRSRLKIAAAKAAHLVIVVLDREQQDRCPGEFAHAVLSFLTLDAQYKPRIQVVIKDRCFENWLVADISSLAKFPKRFQVSQNMRRIVEPGKADRCDGQALMRRAVIGRSGYDKVEDARRICGALSVAGVARNSRSFRHFLHVVGDRQYLEQCKTASTADHSETAATEGSGSGSN